MCFKISSFDKICLFDPFQGLLMWLLILVEESSTEDLSMSEDYFTNLEYSDLHNSWGIDGCVAD
jgi:hypothetical protein